jgi:hypothetical protein
LVTLPDLINSLCELRQVIFHKITCKKHLSQVKLLDWLKNNNEINHCGAANQVLSSYLSKIEQG